MAKKLSKSTQIRYVFFTSLMMLMVNGTAYPASFEIDEIITAIKQEIQTARAMESGKPNFEIESVNVKLALVSNEMERSGLDIKVAAFESGETGAASKLKPFHRLNFSFKPTGASDFSSESSQGLVEAIKKVKTSLRKAYNNPPRFTIDSFQFTLEFAIEKKPDGGVDFHIIDLGDLKAQHIATHKLRIRIIVKK